MAEPVNQTTDASTPKVGAPKDKNCPYCGQAFTSSSLGRHLDLYIKEKNPKPPDGLHDVDAIRKIRGGITRRQPRGSLGGRRDGSTPAGTPTPKPLRKDSGSNNQENDGYRSPAMPKDGFAVDSSVKYSTPFQPTWEATGVMNDIPRKGNWDADNAPAQDQNQNQNKRPGMQRTVSKQVVQKANFDAKHKVADAMDTARAAELALRELVSSLRAAKLQIDTNSMPFDFDPLSLDFPALTLQCLQPPPTLFSSTQHPTSTSWSVQSPGQREFDALRSYFQEEFRTWKITCAAATASTMEEFTYPPSAGPFRDAREAVRKAEKSAENLEAQVNEHLQSAYAVWESLPAPRRHELWVLELARSVGRKHKEAEAFKEQQHRLKQEIANLKSQVDQLNRLQQPREFKLSQPVTIPIDRELLSTCIESGFNGGQGVGFSVDDRHVDLGTVVARTIERWKSVITSSRVTATGMNAQRPLDQTPQPSGPAAANGPPQSQQNQQKAQAQPPPSLQLPASKVQTPQQPVQQTPQQKQQQQQGQQQSQQLTLKRLSTTSTNGMSSEAATNSTTTTGPPSIEETSDQDADAEMEDDDSFAIMNTSPVKPAPPMQQQATLEVPRTRGPVPQRNTPDHRFMLPNGTGSPVGRQAINLSRSMPNMNMAMQNASMQDMSMAMQGVRGDPMYME